MFTVFWAQWRKERRSPFMLIIFLSLSIVGTVLMSMTTNNKMLIDVFGVPELTTAEETAWIQLLNQSEAYQFKMRAEQPSRDAVREGRADVAIKLSENNYKIISAIESPNVVLVEQHVFHVFAKEMQIREASTHSGDENQFRADVEHNLQRPALTLQTQAWDGNPIVKYDINLQFLFGLTLFLVIYTIGFKVTGVLMEKTTGVWNRVILSPVRKTEMYLGHLIYSFLIGFIQIIIVFLIFHYGFGYQLMEHFDMILVICATYMFTMVAFAMLLAGVMRTPEQFSSLLSATVPIMPMLGGIYVPPGTITNKFILGISEIFPLTHAMKALTGVAMFNESLTDVAMPIAKLLFIGVICMGVGINLMERRKA
ncbi:ABC transporter permease [Paenibacillus sp. FSL K6-2524]|uniref:ABC transporter permease n=1 Tax=Paenibacillus sp. FSL K6-2524 TaxID=2954516 RepID=UPI0030FB6042